MLSSWKHLPQLRMGTATAAATLCVLLMGRTLLSATIRFAEVPDEPSVDTVPLPASTVEAQRLVKELRDQRTRLNKVIAGQYVPNASSDPRNAAHPSPLLDRSWSFIEHSEQSRTNTLSEISKQIDALESILARQRNELALANKHSRDEQPPPPAPQDRPQNTPPPVTIIEEAKEEQTAGPVAILDAAVDRMQLADSLFGAHEYQSALEVYRGIESQALDGYESAWVRYQMAACLRKLGSTAQAEKYYRVVAGLPNAEHLSDYARWWLDSIETAKALSTSLKQFNASLQATRQAL